MFRNARATAVALALCLTLGSVSAAVLMPTGMNRAAAARAASLRLNSDMRIRVPLNSPGAMMSLSQSSLNYINGILTPILTNIIQGLSLPEIKVNKDGFQAHLFDIHTVTYQPGNTELQLVAGQGLELGLQNFYLHIHAHFDAKQTGFPWLSTAGTAECYTHNAVATATIGIGASGGKPTVHANNVNVNVGKFDVVVHDGLLGGLLNLLENLFQNQVKNAVDGAIQGAVSNIINNLNGQLKKVNLDVPMGNFGAVASFDMTGSPKVTGQYIGIDAVGAVTAPHQRPPQGGVGPSVPPFSSADADHYMQLGISTYFFETMAWAYEEAGQLSTTVKHSAIPSDFVFQLNTTDLSAFAPALKKVFPNMWCQLHLGVNGSTTVTASSSGFKVVAPLMLAVQPVTPHGPTTAFEIECNATVAAKLDVSQSGSTTKLTGNLTYVSCPLKPGRSAVGPVSVVGLDVLINFVLSDLAVPVVNKILNAGFDLPSLGAVTLSDSKLTFEDNAVVVASNFKLSTADVDAFTQQVVAEQVRTGQRPAKPHTHASA